MTATDGHPWTKKELLIHRVDRLAETTPHAVFAEFPAAHDYEGGFREVTYGSLANAVNALAWWLEGTLGRGRDFETLAYIGPNDLRYTALTLGAMLFVCPHNLVAAQSNLFTLLKCRTLLVGETLPSLADVGLDTVKPRVAEVPSVAALLRKRSPYYSYGKTFEEARSEPLVALHTSGSAGFPKPIVWTNDFAAAYIIQASLEPPSGFESQDQKFQHKRVFVTFPPYNGAYIVNHLFNAIPRGTVMISAINTPVPTTQGLIEGLQKTTADMAFLAPSVVVTLAREPSQLDFVRRRVRSLMYCGGTVPPALGAIVASRIQLLNQYGASEIGLTAAIRCESDDRTAEEKDTSGRNGAVTNGSGPPEHLNGHTNGNGTMTTSRKESNPLSSKTWNHVRFHPSIGAQMRHFVDDMYELVIVRNNADQENHDSLPDHVDINEAHPDYHLVPTLNSPFLKTKKPSPLPLQPAFAFFPHASEYHTRDLWSRHPMKPGLWLLRARIDDLFTLGTGRMINPIPYEQQILASNPLINGALLFGKGKSQPGLLVELWLEEEEQHAANGDSEHQHPNGNHSSAETNAINGMGIPVDTQTNPTPAVLSGIPMAKGIKGRHLESVRATVEAVNRTVPAHMRVRQELIVVVDPTKPMHRAGKGTMQRQLTLGMYAEEVERAYKGFEVQGGEESRNGGLGEAERKGEVVAA